MRAPWFAWLCLGLAACAVGPSHEGTLLASLPADCRQAVVVTEAKGARHAAQLSLHERTDAGWKLVLGPWPAVTGRSGIVDAAAKREGDGGTPGGVHAVRLAFGYESSLTTGLAYRQATAQDHWIDEPTSPSYNRWVTGKPAVSAERMRRDDDQYEVGCVLEWNTTDPVPGHGSAIFFHVWAAPDVATSGCVAVTEEHARAILARLHVDLNPVFVVGKPH